MRMQQLAEGLTTLIVTIPADNHWVKSLAARLSRDTCTTGCSRPPYRRTASVRRSLRQQCSSVCAVEKCRALRFVLAVTKRQRKRRAASRASYGPSRSVLAPPLALIHTLRRRA